MKSKYIVSELDGKTYCATNGHFQRHLEANNYTIQKYYELFIFKEPAPVCPHCLKNNVVFIQKTKSYRKSCSERECKNKAISNAHLSRSKEEIDKSSSLRKETCMEKYGSETAVGLETTIKKRRKTMAEIMPCGRTREQIMQENRYIAIEEKYGDRFYNNSKQISETKQSFTKEKNNKINEKRRKTNLEKYGVENYFLLPNVLSTVGKTNNKNKEYILPSGRIVAIRGHEPMALDKLLEQYEESDLIIGDESLPINERPPVIEYTINGKKKKYYPDILIVSENKIIEVKSQWWFDGNGAEKYKDRLETNMQKKKYSEINGYSFEFWVFDSKGGLTII